MSDVEKLKHVHDALKKKFKDKKLVFGQGDLDAKIVFVSEILGSQEEKEDKPLAGLAEKTLNQLLKTAGINKKKVYVTNVVKYNPLNKIPTPKEIKSHSTFLKEELRTINPMIVVTLGNLALNGVGMRQPLDNVHGRTFNLGSYDLLPTFHPTHGAKDAKIKALLETDFIKLKTILATKEKEAKEAAKN
jgi:uracil-DNA glycosylase